MQKEFVSIINAKLKDTQQVLNFMCNNLIHLDEEAFYLYYCDMKEYKIANLEDFYAVEEKYTDYCNDRKLESLGGWQLGAGFEWVMSTFK